MKLFAGKWMELESLMLSKICQAQKTNVTCCSYVKSRPKKNDMIVKGGLFFLGGGTSGVREREKERVEGGQYYRSTLYICV
jgi:hypothetical protein